MLLFLSDLSDEEINAVSDYWRIDDSNGDFEYSITNVSKKYSYTSSQLSKFLSRAPKVGIYELDKCCPFCSEPITFSSRSELKKYITLTPKSVCNSCISTIVSSAKVEVNKKLELLFGELRAGFDIEQAPYHLKVCLYLLLTKFKVSEGYAYSAKNPVLSGSYWVEDKIYSDLSSMLLLIDVQSLGDKRLGFYEECIPKKFDLDRKYLIKNRYINSSIFGEESTFLDFFPSHSDVFDTVLSTLEEVVYSKKMSINDFKELKLFISDILVRRLSYIVKIHLENLNIPYDDNKKLASKMVEMTEKYSIHKCCWLVFKTLKELEKYLVGKDVPHFKLKHYFLKFLNDVESKNIKVNEVVLDNNYVSYFERFFCVRILEKEILNFNYMSLKEIMAVVANKTIN